MKIYKLIMKMTNWKKDPITYIFFSFIILVVINNVTTIDYSYRQDEISKNVTQNDARTTRQILELTTKIKKLKKTYTLQEGTEHVLQFGALLRTQILDIFGYLVYDRYDDFSIAQMEALYRVYHETLERKYNIFDIIPSILKNADIRPTKICRHINENIHTCLKESSQLCMNIGKHNKRRLINLNYTPQIWQLAKIQQHYPNGISLKTILHHLQNNTLKFTPLLLSGLLHNVQYDSFDDEVRTAERELIKFLTNSSKQTILMTNKEIQSQRTISELLKNYLKNASVELKRPINFHAEILAEHVVREVEAISENIELLGIVYENNTINLKYLFDLILPPDVIDKDLIKAKEYLLRKTDELQVISKYLRIEKYQQAGPDQLLMEILGQMRDIHFAVDIVSALHTHARFWHKSRPIENVNELLELFSAYENLRGVDEYKDMMKVIHQIKDHLSESKNVSIEISCSQPRACLQIGLQVVMKCAYVDNDTKNLIQNFFDKVARNGNPVKEECPLINTYSIENENKNPDVIIKSNEPGKSIESRRGFSTTTKNILSEEESKPTTFLDNSDSSSRTSVPLPTKSSINIDTTEIPVDSMEIEITSTSIPANEKETTSSEEITTRIKTVITTIGEDAITTNKIHETTTETSTSTRVSTMRDTTENSQSIESSTLECSNSEECSTECLGENCPNSTEDCSNDDCTTKKSCEGDECKIEHCSGQNCTSTECEGSECLSIKCNNSDCLALKENTTCDGENCSEEKEAKINCEGKDCSNMPEKIGCEGSGCLKEEEIDCTGSDCPDNEKNKDCEGSDCLNKIESSCIGSECLESDCKGENCPENLQLKNSKNKTTTLCSNKDPHRQRKKERLQKMHQFDIIFSTTSKYHDMVTEITTPNEDYSSIDEVKATKVDEGQTAKVHSTRKKKNSQHHSNTEKVKDLRKTKRKNSKRNQDKNLKNSDSKLDDNKTNLSYNKSDISSKNLRKEKKKQLLDPKEKRRNKNNFNSSKDRQKARKMKTKKWKKSEKHKPKGNQGSWIQEDTSVNDNLSKEKDEMKKKNLDAMKNYDLSENLSKNENSLQNSYENKKATNSYRRSNYPKDSEDMRFLYQTPKPTLKPAQRSFIDDLLEKYDEKPENQEFGEIADEKSSDEIDRNMKIVYADGKNSNFSEDSLGNEEDYSSWYQ